MYVSFLQMQIAHLQCTKHAIPSDRHKVLDASHNHMQDGESQDGGLVFSWAEHRVCLYLDALRRHLPRITEGGSLASVLEHCMYCGMSLARVGLDIRGLLPPIFEACVMNLFSKV